MSVIEQPRTQESALPPLEYETVVFGSTPYMMDIDAGRTDPDSDALELISYRLDSNDRQEKESGIEAKKPPVGFRAEAIRSVVMFGFKADPEVMSSMTRGQLFALDKALTGGDEKDNSVLQQMVRDNRRIKRVDAPAIREYVQTHPETMPAIAEAVALNEVVPILESLGNEEFVGEAHELFNRLQGNELITTFSTISRLLDAREVAAKIFDFDPPLQGIVAYSYVESVAKLIFAMNKLKSGEKVPRSVPLRSGRHIPLGSYTYEEALETLDEFTHALRGIESATGASSPVISTVRDASYGMFRFGSKGQVLAMIRPHATNSYDPAIEYGGKHGAEASIGYTIDYGKSNGFTHMEIKEQKNPFNIRLDNEGEGKISLDIGSILGKPGTLGKKVADLITIGDIARAEKTGKEAQLNHNRRIFDPNVGGAWYDDESFARIAANASWAYYRRAKQTDMNQFALKQAAVASPLQSAGSR